MRHNRRVSRSSSLCQPLEFCQLFEIAHVHRHIGGPVERLVHKPQVGQVYFKSVTHLGFDLLFILVFFRGRG